MCVQEKLRRREERGRRKGGSAHVLKKTGERARKSAKLYVSSAKEPYKRDYILKKRRIILGRHFTLRLAESETKSERKDERA